MADSLLVAPCEFAAASYAVKNWHYSGTMPAPRRVMFGVWEHGEFAGVVIYSRGGSPNLGKPYKLAHYELCELTRIALKQHAAPVSQIVSLSLKALKRNSPGLRLVVSFADPLHCHHGGIYQASNWLYLGVTGGDTQFIVHGRRRHSRSMAGIQFGSGRVTRQSIGYLREHIDPNARSVRMPPKHRYAWPYDRAMRRRLLPFVEPYPERMTEPATVR